MCILKLFSSYNEIEYSFFFSMIRLQFDCKFQVVNIFAENMYFHTMTVLISASITLFAPFVMLIIHKCIYIICLANLRLKPSQVEPI